MNFFSKTAFCGFFRLLVIANIGYILLLKFRDRNLNRKKKRKRKIFVPLMSNINNCFLSRSIWLIITHVDHDFVSKNTKNLDYGNDQHMDLFTK